MRLRFLSMFLALLVGAAYPAVAAPPAARDTPAAEPSARTFTARLHWPVENPRRQPDGDTFDLVLPSGETAKARLHWADTPEIKHLAGDPDQPGGREALAYVLKHWQDREVRITRRGASYSRLVVDAEDAATGESLGLDLVKHGHAQLDPRFKPPEEWLAAQAAARRAGKGLWAADSPTSPWAWRKRIQARHARQAAEAEGETRGEERGAR